MGTVLIVTGRSRWADDLVSAVKQDWRPLVVETGATALDILRSQRPGAVIVDAPSTRNSTETLLRAMREGDVSPVPVLVIDAAPDISRTVALMQAGAADILDQASTVEVVAEHLNTLALEPGEKPADEQVNGEFISCGEAMRHVNVEIDRLARVGFDVLLLGETGVGKDVVAMELHRRSRRAAHPFIHVPISSLSETLIESELFGHERGAFSDAVSAKIGKLEAANGGTIYLPEVSSLPERIQLKLLQFMQYKTISRVGQDPRKPLLSLDVRLIMATNEELEGLVNSGRLRRDFYHRITGVRLTIPPLRQRLESIETFARHFLHKYGRDSMIRISGFTPATLDLLRSYSWPGNVRELENTVKNAIAHATGPLLSPECFPDVIPSTERCGHCSLCLKDHFAPLPPYHELEQEFRRAYYEEVLRRSGMEIPKAAELTGITPQGFRKAIKALGIESG